MKTGQPSVKFSTTRAQLLSFKGLVGGINLNLERLLTGRWLGALVGCDFASLNFALSCFFVQMTASLCQSFPLSFL